MISIETLLLEFQDLQPTELDRWISNAWVKPERRGGTYQFHDIDIARIRLILELRTTLEVNEPALPTVLSLLDQVYEMRRDMRKLNEALAEVPPDVRSKLMAQLGSR